MANRLLNKCKESAADRELSTVAKVGLIAERFAKGISPPARAETAGNNLDSMAANRSFTRTRKSFAKSVAH